MKLPKLSPGLRRLFHIIVGFAFLLSGWTKAAHPQLFADHLQYRLAWFPDAMAWPFTLLLTLAELLIGAMLVTMYRESFARKVAVVLLTLFVLYLLLGLVLGQNQPCQCYGNLVELHPLVSMGVDILLLCMLYLLEKHATAPQQSFRPFVGVCFGIVLLLIASLTTALFDPFLVRLKPGMELPVLPSLHPLAINRDPERLVIMAREPLEEQQIQALEKAYPQHRILILLPNIPEAYPIRRAMVLPAKPDMLATFAKTFPTSFRLKNQQVREIWWGRLPEIP